MPAGSAAVRDYIRERVVIEDRGYTSPCWIWQQCLTEKGYACGYVNGGTVKMHRHAYEAFVGPLPKRKQVDHLCRVRSCLNPEHLEPVTGRENTLRGFSPAALNARKTHCVRGHAFTAENTLTGAKGGRQCRACWNARRPTGTPPGPKRICPNGHEYTADEPPGSRKNHRPRCSICNRDRRDRENIRRQARRAAARKSLGESGLPSSGMVSGPERTSAAGKSDVWGHHENGLTP